MSSSERKSRKKWIEGDDNDIDDDNGRSRGEWRKKDTIGPRIVKRVKKTENVMEKRWKNDERKFNSISIRFKRCGGRKFNDGICISLHFWIFEILPNFSNCLCCYSSHCTSLTLCWLCWERKVTFNLNLFDFIVLKKEKKTLLISNRKSFCQWKSKETEKSELKINVSSRSNFRLNEWKKTNQRYNL